MSKNLRKAIRKELTLLLGSYVALLVIIASLTMFWGAYHNVDLSFNHYLLESHFVKSGNIEAFNFMEDLCDVNGRGDCNAYDMIYSNSLIYVVMGMFGFAFGMFFFGLAQGRMYEREIRKKQRKVRL